MEEIFNRLYDGHEYFANFPYDEIRYRDRIDRIRKSIGDLKKWADKDADSLKADLATCPRPKRNIRAQLRWEGSQAECLLKIDVDNGLHLLKTPAQLRSDRPEYKLFDLLVFQKHVDQEKQSRKKYDEKTTAKRYKNANWGNPELSRKQQSEQQQTGVL